MNPSFAQAGPRALTPGEPDYAHVLEAAAAPLHEAAGERAALDVERVDRLGPWAFVLGTMRAPGGGRPDFSGTRFADAAEAGGMSDVYVVLLRAGDPPDAAAAPADAAARDQAGLAADDGDDGRSTKTWTVVDHAIGPGDVAWLDWPVEHAAPRALFGF